MTTEIAIVLSILLVSIVLFITEVIRMDVVALLVLVALAFTGLVTPEEALAGFSNPAVVTVWAMFILSEGLTETGVAGSIGRQVLKMAGANQFRMIMAIMLTAGVLSAFMNNIGVAAFMLPVVITIARKTNVPPSRLLMPLAYGSLLGGLTTMIGTPPNLLISNGLREAGYKAFTLFDFTPMGGVIMIVGSLFVALVAHRLLPSNNAGQEKGEASNQTSLREQYALGDRSFFLKLNKNSLLARKTLQEINLGQALGLFVVALQRNGKTLFSPGPQTMLEEGDRLYTQGDSERLNELLGWHDLKPVGRDQQESLLNGDSFSIVEATISEDADFIGQTLKESDFRKHFGLNALLVFQSGKAIDRNLGQLVLHAGERLILQGPQHAIDAINSDPAFEKCKPAPEALVETYSSIRNKLFEVQIPNNSWLDGKALSECRLRQRFDFHVISIKRNDSEITLPDPQEPLQAGDKLMLHSRPETLDILKGIQQLEIEPSKEADATMLEADDVEMVEATLAPNAQIAGRTVAEIQLSARYGVQLLCILRSNESHRSNLGEMSIQFGDALLLIGPHQRLKMLRDDKDFLLLSQLPENGSSESKKPLAASAIMAMVVFPVLFGVAPIALTAIAGAIAMVLAGCLKMEDAYRAIEWRAVFLIAGMLPLGTAIQQTGAASYLTAALMGVIGDFGPWTVIGGLYLITSAATTIIPTAALVVLMSPIAIQSSIEMGFSPHTSMMAIAMAASASFTSPISHPANVLVMGPGGYRFVDYIKVGLPLAIVVFIASMTLLPFFWPL